MDSICSATAYAELKRLSGHENVVAARAGHTNERIDFVLEKFAIPAPLLINDLSPRVEDVMQPHVVSVRADLPIYDAVQLIDSKHLRGLPVVDERNHCLGLLSTFKITHYLFPPRDEAASARLITASLADIVTTFGGALVSGSAFRRARRPMLLMVGAMNAQDSFTPAPRKTIHGPPKVVLFVGDRPHIQELGDQGARLRHRRHWWTSRSTRKSAPRARAAANVTMISSPHDTATSVLLTRGAVRVQQNDRNADYRSFQPRHVCSTTPASIAAQIRRRLFFPSSTIDGTLVGILSKSDFLKEIPRQLILVDHNELSPGRARRGQSADRRNPRSPQARRLLVSDYADPFLEQPRRLDEQHRRHVLPATRHPGASRPSPGCSWLASFPIPSTSLRRPTTPDRLRPAQPAGEDRRRPIPDELAEQIFSVGSPLLTMTRPSRRSTPTANRTTKRAIASPSRRSRS